MREVAWKCNIASFSQVAVWCHCDIDGFGWPAQDGSV